MRCLVTGAAGFIPHHLARRLRAEGHWVRGVDVRYHDHGPLCCDEFRVGDLRGMKFALDACRHVDWVFDLAADMGGLGWIHHHTADLMHANTIANANVLEAARLTGVSRYLFTSSVCVYNETQQAEAHHPPTRESDAFPAQPDTAYGWQKLYHELLCGYAATQYGFDVRIVRFNNTYGPESVCPEVKEKAPHALARKIARAKLLGLDHIEVWGDGQQTRTFMDVDDAVDGVLALMRHPSPEPGAYNLGNDELVTIDQLADLLMDAAGYRCAIVHDPSKPQGVRGRLTDNSRAETVLGWRPRVPLRDGLARLYRWIEDQERAKLKVAA